MTPEPEGEGLESNHRWTLRQGRMIGWRAAVICSLREASAHGALQWWRPGKSMPVIGAQRFKWRCSCQPFPIILIRPTTDRCPCSKMPSVSPHACPPFLHTQLKQKRVGIRALLTPLPQSGQMSTPPTNRGRRRQRALQCGPSPPPYPSGPSTGEGDRVPQIRPGHRQRSHIMPDHPRR